MQSRKHAMRTSERQLARTPSRTCADRNDKTPMYTHTRMLTIVHASTIAPGSPYPRPVLTTSLHASLCICSSNIGHCMSAHMNV
eukprot:2763596-Pleurochrysis_carterae.AAC.1